MRLRFTLVLLLAAGASGADWPQWRGPARDGLVPGLSPRAEWPAALKQAWRVPVGLGHSSPLVAGDRVFVFTREGGEEAAQAIELASGKRVWRQAYPAPYTMNPAAASHGPGPKATAVLAEGRLFTYGIGGILSAFDAASGRLVWRKEFASQYRSTSPPYGAAASPVADGGRLIAYVGGNDDGALTAFDAATGAPRWSWKGDGPGYASPVVAEVGGVRQVITQSQTNLVGVAADTGALLWKIPFTTEWVQNAITPIVEGDVVVYSGLDHPLKAVRLVREAGTWVAKPVWENAEVSNYMSTPVRTEGRLFGLSAHKKGQLFCLDETTGRTIWISAGRQGDNAALAAGGGAVFVLTTEGELVVLSAAASSFAPLRRYTVAPSATWAHPVILAGGVIVKDVDSLGYWKWE
jgi:outer membrane protein assembly factor BamB